MFGSALYAGTDIGQIWRTTDGTLWTRATLSPGLDQNITDLTVFGGQLYANQAATSPAGVFRSSDGANWSRVLTFGEPQLEYTHDLATFGSQVYSAVGSYKGYLGPGDGELWRSPDGSSSSQSGSDGFGNPDNTDVSGLAVFGGSLFAGTFNGTDGAEVWLDTDEHARVRHRARTADSLVLRARLVHLRERPERPRWSRLGTLAKPLIPVQRANGSWNRSTGRGKLAWARATFALVTTCTGASTLAGTRLPCSAARHASTPS